MPDLDVRFIGRTPRYDWDGAKKWPAAGETVTFEGHVANRGTTGAGQFDYRWLIDDQPQDGGTIADIAPSGEVLLAFDWVWSDGPHTVILELDPDDRVAEVSELNNQVTDRTNGLALGIYVEQSFYDFFNANVKQAGWGGNSFDDWLRRHVSYWNDAFEHAVWPSAPAGIIDRIRLDKVVVVPDGGNRCNTNRPTTDNEIDLIWGFSSEMVGVVSSAKCHWTPRYRDDRSSWDLDPGLIHELNHARYVIDLYGFNFGVHRTTLAFSLGPDERSISLSAAPPIPEYEGPAHFIIEGETIYCPEGTGPVYEGCVRGARNTTRRAHSPGAEVLAGQAFVTDGQGNALAGGAALPFSGREFHRQRDFGFDIMNSGRAYGEHSAFAWNRIAGQRPRCGNYNAPCNIGEYLNDLPDRNQVRLTRDGHPIDNAVVEMHRAGPYRIWYGKSFAETPDLVLTADDSGLVDLGAKPFGDGGLVHGHGHSNGVLLFVVKDDEEVGTAFLDVTEMNVAYARGQRESATYDIEVEHWADIGTVVVRPTVTPDPTSTPGPGDGTRPTNSVLARTGWQATAAEAESGAEIHLRVDRGRWTHWAGTEPRNPGTGGSYVCAENMPRERCLEPLPEAPQGALIGRIGGALFAVGSGTTLSARTSGGIELRINDGDGGLGDNDGELHVALGVASTVDARERWQATGARVVAGAAIMIEVTDGTWTHWAGSAPRNPGTGGDYICAESMPRELCLEPLPEAPQGALVGRIGGALFAVGSRTTLSAPTSGLVALRINDADGGLGDNDGELAVVTWIGGTGSAVWKVFLPVVYR